MVNTCTTFGCRNRADDAVKRSYYVIPIIRRTEGSRPEQLSTERRELWLARVNRKNYTPTAYTKVCSDHFVQGGSLPFVAAWKELFTINLFSARIIKV